MKQLEKEKNLESKILLFLTGLPILIVLLGIHRFDCYYFHVVECEDCHNQGLGFSVCSGWCHNSTDIANYCYVDLTENCKTNIAHGCNIASNERIDGWCIPFTEWCLYV